MQRKRNAPQPLELQRSRTRTMGVGRGLVALSAAAAAPLTHITSHNTALQLSMRSSSRASRQHADTRQACNHRRARTCKDSHPRALSRHTCLPHPPMRTPSVRAQSTPAQSMPAQMRCVWRSSSAAPDRCRRDMRPRGARIAHTPLEEQIRPAALDSTRSIEPTATSTSRPSLWRPVRLRDLVLVDVALAASGRAMERFKRLQRRAL